MNSEICQRYRASYKGKEDIHTRLMRRYADIPSWWFYLLLVVTIAVSLALCIFLNDEVQMPWWGLIFAAAMAFIFTLPISIITATTNQVYELTHCSSFSFSYFAAWDVTIGINLLLCIHNVLPIWKSSTLRQIYLFQVFN